MPQPAPIIRKFSTISEAMLAHMHTLGHAGTSLNSTWFLSLKWKPSLLSFRRTLGMWSCLQCGQWPELKHRSIPLFGSGYFYVWSLSDIYRGRERPLAYSAFSSLGHLKSAGIKTLQTRIFSPLATICLPPYLRFRQQVCCSFLLKGNLSERTSVAGPSPGHS